MPSASPIDLGALLEAVEAAPPTAATAVLSELLGDAFGATEVAFLIADFSGRSLIRVDPAASEQGDRHSDAATVPLAGTPHGEALATQRVAVRTDGAGAHVYAPVTSRGEAVGVLELHLDAAPGDEEIAALATVAHALAYIVIANRRYTDLYEWGQRTRPLSLAAEVQHRLLPGSYTCEAGQFTLAAWLEPAGDVGGDTFDFSLEQDALHVSITDAMGHTVEASLLASVAIGALRNARRRGVDLGAQAGEANAALLEHADAGQYVTGQLVRIDLQAQTASVVNGGHPPPLRLRDGQVSRVELAADPPFGTFVDGAYRVQELSLEPGDRLVFVTDGMLERSARAVDVNALLRDSRDEHPREMVQRLSYAVLEANGGDLADDATALVLDWHGGPPRDRDASAGANR